jgi:hypothetical protein
MRRDHIVVNRCIVQSWWHRGIYTRWLEYRVFIIKIAEYKSACPVSFYLASTTATISTYFISIITLLIIACRYIYTIKNSITTSRVAWSDIWTFIAWLNSMTTCCTSITTHIISIITCFTCLSLKISTSLITSCWLCAVTSPSSFYIASCITAISINVIAIIALFLKDNRSILNLSIDLSISTHVNARSKVWTRPV